MPCPRVRFTLLPVIGLALGTSCAASPHPANAPLGIDYTPPLADAARTQIVVLGTAHLRDLADCLGPSALDAVVERLRAWHPDLIAIEALPPTTIEALEHRDDEFSSLVRDGFAQRSLDASELVKDLVHLSASELRSQRAALIDQPRPTAAERVHLVMLLVASREYPSAVLQWSYLDDAERAAAGVPDELRSRLEASRTSAGETYRIAVPLARSLGQSQLALVDDFAGEAAYATRLAQFTRDVEASPELKTVTSAPHFVEQKTRLREACRDPQRMLAFYRWLNTHASRQVDVALQWGVWFRTHFASGLDRARYAGWEARNLGIAANIRKETSLFAGKRVLVIYGASHKPFLDAYLSQMLDVQIVQPLELLDAGPHERAPSGR